jgi:RNA polymerase sigma-70 factor (ECF subfamily)
MTNPGPSSQLTMVAFEQLKVAPKPARSEDLEAEDCLQVYQRQLDYLIGSLRRLGVVYPDIEDVLHEVFLVMLTRWDDYDRARPIRPWLFGIAFRVASASRRKGTREVLGDESEVEDLGERPDESLAASQNRALLLRALAELPLERRAVLIMHEVDETPMREIATQLSIPLFTAYSRLRKARQEFQAALVRVQKGGQRVR